MVCRRCVALRCVALRCAVLHAPGLHAPLEREDEIESVYATWRVVAARSICGAAQQDRASCTLPFLHTAVLLGVRRQGWEEIDCEPVSMSLSAGDLAISILFYSGQGPHVGRMPHGSCSVWSCSG